MAFPENPGICNVTAWKIRGGKVGQSPEVLAQESLMTLSINGFKACNLLYLPGLETELSVGFLLTSGVIEGMADILEMRLTPGDPAAGQVLCPGSGPAGQNL